MRRPVTKLGKVGSIVWGKNRHGQTHYSLVASRNPRTAPQQANRSGFGAPGPGWGLLKDAERALWAADAREYNTHGRAGVQHDTSSVTRLRGILLSGPAHSSQALPGGRY